MRCEMNRDDERASVRIKTADTGKTGKGISDGLDAVLAELSIRSARGEAVRLYSSLGDIRKLAMLRIFRQAR